MAPSESFFLIMLDQPTTAQRNAVHARVKKATGSWWHKFEDVWIVRGGATIDWSKRLQPVFKTGAASFLVFELPAAGTTRGWAFFGPDANERLAWVHRYYTKDG